MDAIPCEREARKQNAVHCQTYEKGRQLDFEMSTQPGRQPWKSSSKVVKQIAEHRFKLLGYLGNRSQ